MDIQEYMDGSKPLSTSPQYSNIQPIWQLVLLSVITIGIYDIYWFYRNWKQIKIYKNLNISPGWRTVGLLVPIYNFVLIYGQIRDIRDLAQEKVYPMYASPGWLTFQYIFLYGLGFFTSDYWLLSLLAVWPLAVVQNTLNVLWRKEQEGIAVRTRLTWKEIAIVVVCSINWLLFFISIYISIPE